MSGEQSFNYVVGGIEDGIIALESYLHLRGPENPDGYLNQIQSYGGELDEKKVKDVLGQLSPYFPLLLVAYGEGVDKEMPATSSALGERRIFRHECDFLVMACASNARSEEAQRRGAVGDVGVYEMISNIRDDLTGVRFARRGASVVVTVSNKPLPEGDVLLNLEPLRPVGVEFMARLEGMTAYAQRFETNFKWTEPERREAFANVEELVLEINPLGGSQEPGGLPGVILK